MNKHIKTYELDRNYLFVHKKGIVDSDFGLDHTPELIEDGFGLYSSENVRPRIGPLTSQFYRIGFCRKGSLQVNFGLETFTHSPNTIHFNFPGQLFSLYNVSDDMYSMYILFTPAFMEPLIPSLALQTQYPFLDYAGIPFFALSGAEAKKMEQLFLDIDREIKADNPDKAQAIKHIVNLILIHARRSYTRQGLATLYLNTKASSLVIRFKKMVGQHFRKIRSVAGYASRLAVTPKHLGKLVKEETGKTPGDFIDDMILIEVKALLRHSHMTVAEIAYELNFSDPSHLTTFFRKKQGITPLQYRREIT